MPNNRNCRNIYLHLCWYEDSKVVCSSWRYSDDIQQEKWKSGTVMIEDWRRGRLEENACLCVEDRNSGLHPPPSVSSLFLPKGCVYERVCVSLSLCVCVCVCVCMFWVNQHSHRWERCSGRALKQTNKPKGWCLAWKLTVAKPTGLTKLLYGKNN